MKSESRRSFFRTIIMLISLVLSYGTAIAYALRFLYPRKNKKIFKMFVTFRSNIPAGKSLRFSTPGGENFLLTNTGEGIHPYIAFSDRCPHLGCKVYWKANEKIFYCPCHEGAFNSEGLAIKGPPSKAGQSLTSCQIKVVGSSVYAVVEV